MALSLKLVVCGLCGDDQPFCVPTRFRRTYMKLHLEKAHNLSVRSLKLSRHQVAEGQDTSIINWTDHVGDQQRRVLVELELPIPDQLDESLATSAVGDTVQPGPHLGPENPEGWTASAMRHLYSERSASTLMH